MNHCTSDRISVGLWGEETAAAVLQAKGWTILDRNWRPPRAGSGVRGEIDIVARRGSQIIVCEVKTRSSLSFGHPCEAVDAAKAARLCKLAGAWCTAAGQRRDRVRIDVIAIVGHERRFSVEHLEGVL